MDLHLHTSASADYQEPSATYLDFLQIAEARGLEIIAFTDHNSVAGYRRLQDELAELELLERLKRLNPEEKNRLDEYRRLLDKILVLPGFEFTATFGFHILGLFPLHTPVRALEHLLLSLHVPPDQLDQGSATVGATSDVLTAYRLINESGGLAIAAHANSTNGVAMRGFTFGGQTKIAYTQDPNLHALEVTDLEQKGRRTTAAFFSGSKPEYPRRMHCIQGSDAHRLKRDPHNTKNLGIGDRATDVLLGEVTFETLKALFLGNDFARTRPRYGKGATHAQFDYIQQAREEGPNIVQDFHDSMTARSGKLHVVVADVCAFANTNGGTLYVGVSREPKQPPVGVTNPEQAVKELRGAIDRLLTPRLACTVDVQESRGKKLIRVMVPRGDDQPYALEESKIYVREEAETSLAVRDEIVQLVLRRFGPVGVSPVATTAVAVAPEPERPLVEVPPKPSDGRPRTPVMVPTAEVVGPPRTGVEIVSTEERGGVRYHAMRDLRNGNIIKNVTRASARKLWHYAITEREAGGPKLDAVKWVGSVGLYKKRDKGGITRYDLVQRTSDGLRVYYGVTDDGIHGEWKRVVGEEDKKAPAVSAAPVLIPPDEAPAPELSAEAAVTGAAVVEALPETPAALERLEAVPSEAVAPVVAPSVKPKRRSRSKAKVAPEAPEADAKAAKKTRTVGAARPRPVKAGRTAKANKPKEAEGE